MVQEVSIRCANGGVKWHTEEAKKAVRCRVSHIGDARRYSMEARKVRRTYKED